jgi:hypothetical protein
LFVCDHFEPRHEAADEAQVARRVATWRSGYQSLQEDCWRLYGLRPCHTWFYPPHHGEASLPALASMAFAGLGEVELHYHHQNDTAASLRQALAEALARYHRWGLLQQVGDPPRRSFGFIHGDWALNNSAHGRFCGVNGELAILGGLGCWADLTQPSANECQTRKINSVYYALGDETRPKGHDRGRDATVVCSGNLPRGRRGAGGSAPASAVASAGRPLLIQGPLGINVRGRGYPRIENSSLTTRNWGSPDRIRTWIRCHIHVRGRPEWLFVKLHAHGAVERDFDALFGERARAMHRTLAERYNDGKRFKLHYVTARQAFNVIRAAEQGLEGDPVQYVDHEIPPQVTSLYGADVTHELRCCTPHRLRIEALDTSRPCEVRLRHPALAGITARMRSLELHSELLEIVSADEIGVIRLRLAQRGVSIRSVEGGRIVGERAGGEMIVAGGRSIKLALSPGRTVTTTRAIRT